MKIMRTEEGRIARTTTLEIDEITVEKINKDLKEALVSGVKFTPLTVEETWAILTDSVKASRFTEEYFVELEFYSGNIKLGDFVRLTINDMFAELPGETDEDIEIWYDEFYP